jgi:hypothetical protein
MRVNVFDYVNDDTAIAYDDGKKCLDAIIDVIDKEKVIIDFAGIDYVITAFLNPLIGDLILKKGNGVMKNIDIQNANDGIIEKIKIVKNGALLKREDIR